MEINKKKVFETLMSKALEGVFFARAGLYLVESYPLVYIDQWIQRGKFQKPKNSLTEKELFEEVRQLIQNDVENINKGIYHLSAVRIENPVTHIKNLYKVYKDSILVSKKKKEKKSKVFSEEAKQKTEGLPEYYRRNFHFQTDGYLSEDSASIYDHQIDILFRGTADAMRRLILKPMVEALGSERRLQILEVGCGTGVSTFPIANTFRKSRVKAIDLSEDYISYCSKEYKSLKLVSFAQGQGENLESVKSESQDAWCSTYMFHELPKDIRIQTISEAMRVLKPGGFIFIVDSIQLHDRPDLKAIIDVFPKNFHEPYYKNYAQMPLEGLLTDAGFIEVKSDSGFVTKVCWAQKPFV
jgi:ubiquinone/menaquinone biosynthesis C-methylase UbiE